jgi:hypothetical protein
MLTPTNAAKITDLASWKEVVGKRFRLSKEEKACGLTPERALAERVREALLSQKPQEEIPLSSGEIVIRIVPQRGVDLQGLRLPDGSFTIEQDDKFYNWLDTLLTGPYNEFGATVLIKHLIHMGHGELLTSVSFPRDVADYEGIAYENDDVDGAGPAIDGPGGSSEQ